MSAFEAAGVLFPDDIAEPVKTFQELWEETQNLFAPYSALADLDIPYITEPPKPKTPYSYNKKVWIHDKRPGRHHIRSNCRKDR